MESGGEEVRTLNGKGENRDLCKFSVRIWFKVRVFISKRRYGAFTNKNGFLKIDKIRGENTNVSGRETER